MMNKKNIYVLIAGLILLHALLFVFLPLTDPSEARYATIAKQMVESGNYIMPHIRIQGDLVPFMGKPPFGFWMISGSIKLFGLNEFAVRFPSFIASLLLLLIIYFSIKRVQGEEHAAAAAMITATTAGFYLLSGVVLVDMWLCLFAIGSIFFYYLYIHENDIKIKKRFSLLVFIFLAAGFITKGPVCLIFFGLPVFFWTLLSNRWETLKHHAWITGSLLFLLIVLPWFFLAEKHIPGYCHYFFVVENFERFVSPDKSGDLYSKVSHSVPKGFAVLYSLVVCLPWVLVMLLVYSIRKKSVNAFFPAVKRGIIKIKENSFRKYNHDFNIFLTGLISISLFWSISSHIMLYYMVLVTPLFAVWCAEILLKYSFNVKKIAYLSLLILILYSISAIPAYFILDAKKSTRNITLKAVKMRKEKNLKGKIIFVRKMSYSSYFYGGDLILPHKDESIAESLLRSSGEGNNGSEDIYALHRRYVKRTPAEIRKLFKIEYKNRYWALMTRLKNEKQEIRK